MIFKKKRLDELPKDLVASYHEGKDGACSTLTWTSKAVRTGAPPGQRFCFYYEHLADTVEESSWAGISKRIGWDYHYVTTLLYHHPEHDQQSATSQAKPVTSRLSFYCEGD